MTALPVVIFGAGDFARVAAQYLSADSPHHVVAFTVHERHLPEQPTLCGLPVVAFEQLDVVHPPDTCALFVAIGFSRVNQARADVVAECGARGFRLISYVSSGAAYWRKTPIGANTFIFENNVIQPFVTIGNDVILCSGGHIGHDVTIGDHVFVASHAVISANCTIGAYSFIGVNATIQDGVTIAPRCVIGTGAVVARDTDEGDVLGVPNARLLPDRSSASENRGSVGRESIEIDDDLVSQVMANHGLATKSAAIDYALRRLGVDPMSREEALAMRGSGWQIGPGSRQDRLSDR